MTRIAIYDTTLRDGSQGEGVNFSLQDKLLVARQLDHLGIDYIEGGYPGANPTDTQLFSEERKLGTTFTAFGMTRRPGRSASNDPGLAALLEAKADAICFVAKSWDYHVRVALETTLEENLASIRDSVQAAKAKGRASSGCFAPRLALSFSLTTSCSVPATFICRSPGSIRPPGKTNLPGMNLSLSLRRPINTLGSDWL